MSDGFSNEGMPSTELSAKDIMSQLGSSNADGFNVPITTSDVVGGMGNVKPVTLTASDGTSIFCEHHDIGILPMPAPTQDVPPGETQAKP